MNILELIQRITDSLAELTEVDEKEAVRLIAGYEAEFDAVTQRIVKLVRQRAGIDPTEPRASPAVRLNSLDLSAYYPQFREDALQKIIVDNRRTLAQLVGPLMEAATKIAVAEAELALEAERSERVKEKMSERRRNGLYIDVASVAERLHESFDIQYHHWKSLSNESLASIAAILER